MSDLFLPISKTFLIGYNDIYIATRYNLCNIFLWCDRVGQESQSAIQPVEID